MTDHVSARFESPQPRLLRTEARSEPALLTVEQAAERLGTPVRFVRRLVAQRRISFCRVGRYVRIAPADLAAFIEAGRVLARDGGRDDDEARDGH